MGLKNSKKPAMVLVLIIMIITSLSIFIIGAMKILTSLNGEYSENRNFTNNTSSKASGKFVCYKQFGSLYQQIVEYNVDGSAKTVPTEEEVGEQCEFDIPKNVKSFEVIVVGGGGAGSASTREYQLQSAGSDGCIVNNIYTILKQDGSILNCKLVFSEPSKECTASHTFATNKNFNIADFIKNINCATSGATLVSENCTIKYNNESIKLSSIYNKTENDIKGALAEAVKNKVSCENKNPVYSICVGEPGNAGEVNYVNINSAIYGSKEGSSKIIINKSQIADGGTTTNPEYANGGETTFKYWYKNSKTKEYKEISVSASGGNVGSCNNTTISSSSQVDKIKSKQGKLPSSFDLPSVFGFQLLSPGFYNGATATNATYFGASGASGYIDDMDASKLTDGCKVSVINGTEYDKCSVNPQIRNISGTGGAPGAIVISW